MLQTWNSGKSIKTTTNKFGQPTKRIIKDLILPDINTDYVYDKERPTSVTSTNGTSKGLTYDAAGRLSTMTETVNGKTYQEVYGYENGRIASVIYNTGSGTSLTNLTSVVYKYNGNGYLYRLNDAAGNRLREVNSVNELGQEKSVLLGNGLTTTKNYTPEGLWTNVTTSNNIQNMSFDFNRINGTLNSRTDVSRGLTESFAYDGLYRLKAAGLPTFRQTVNYDTNRNILSKSDVGGYTYDISGKPYTLSKLTNPNLDETPQLNVDYTLMSRPKTISNVNGLSTSFIYNDNFDRVYSELKSNNTIIGSIYYFAGGKYELEPGIQRLYLDGTPYTASIIIEKTGSASPQNYYIHRDYLGSVMQITDNLGNLADENSYDAWGAMRNPANWYPLSTDRKPLPWFRRGFTGHEHLAPFTDDYGGRLINMNARLYDPILGRFLAPDPFVGSGLTNDFNRYIYCRNNPLMFTDPSGKTPWSWLGEQWNKFSNFMNKTFPKGFEVGYGAGLPGNNGRGFFYNGNINGNSSFGGNYNKGTFTTTSNYNGYQSSAVVYSPRPDPIAYQMGQAEQAYMRAETWKQSQEKESLYSNPDNYVTTAGSIGSVLGLTSMKGTPLYVFGNKLSGYASIYGFGKGFSDLYSGKASAYTLLDITSSGLGTADFVYYLRFSAGIAGLGELLLSYSLIRIGTSIYSYYNSSYTPNGYKMYNPNSTSIPTGSNIPVIGNINVVGSEFPQYK